jgi:hypothetical protein
LSLHYIRVDVTPGANVDIVGDAHHLSRAVHETFDHAFSIAVFEHLLTPLSGNATLAAVRQARRRGATLPRRPTMQSILVVSKKFTVAAFGPGKSAS